MRFALWLSTTLCTLFVAVLSGAVLLRHPLTGIACFIAAIVLAFLAREFARWGP